MIIEVHIQCELSDIYRPQYDSCNLRLKTIVRCLQAKGDADKLNLMSFDHCVQAEGDVGGPLETSTFCYVQAKSDEGR